MQKTMDRPLLTVCQIPFTTNTHPTQTLYQDKIITLRIETGKSVC